MSSKSWNMNSSKGGGRTERDGRRREGLQDKQIKCESVSDRQTRLAIVSRFS